MTKSGSVARHGDAGRLIVDLPVSPPGVAGMTRKAPPLFRARPDGGPPRGKIPRHRDDAATYPVGVDCEHVLVADVTVLAGDRTLLVRYRDTSAYDGQAGWFVPDAELNRREHPQRAARRILREQLGVDARRLSLTSIESFGGRGWHLIFHYAVRLRSTPEIHPGSNVLEAAWFSTDGLPPAGETAHEGWAYGIVAAALRTLPA